MSEEPKTIWILWQLQGDNSWRLYGAFEKKKDCDKYYYKPQPYYRLKQYLLTESPIASDNESNKRK